MKKCVLYGNCQLMIYVHKILSKLLFSKTYELIPYANNDRSNTEKLKNINIEHLKNCDIFIYQPLGNNHGVYATDYLLTFLKINCIKISIPYIYNSAFYTIYWEKASPRWRLGTLVNCGWKNIMIMIKNGDSLDKILDEFKNKNIDFYFKERMDTCIQSLKVKEQNCTIKVSDFILNNYVNKKLFHTQNHLTNYFYKWISYEILKNIDIDFVNDLNMDYKLDKKHEANCVNDYYNLNYFGFDYNKSDNIEITKIKIIEFYNYFIKIKDEVNVIDMIPYKISHKEDPEDIFVPNWKESVGVNKW